MSQVIAVCNQKGGVGKTTTTVNLGAGLAELDQRVLLVDLDPQAALTASWDIMPAEQDRTIYNLLLDDRLPVASALRAVRPRIDVLPADINLAAAEIELFSALGRESILEGILARVDDGYDYILVDCPPNLGLLTINALVASDGILIPLQCEYLALRGLGMLLDTLYKIKRKLNPDLEVTGILATLYSTRTIHAREVLEEVQAMFGERVFDTVVRSSIRFAEAALARMPILEYAPSHPGAVAYRAIAKEVLNGRDPGQ
jgi:chromosome partitioning protein